MICQGCNSSIIIVKNNSNREIMIDPSVFTFYSDTYFWSEHTYRQFIYKTHTHTQDRIRIRGRETEGEGRRKVDIKRTYCMYPLAQTPQYRPGTHTCNKLTAHTNTTLTLHICTSSHTTHKKNHAQDSPTLTHYTSTHTTHPPLTYCTYRQHVRTF